MHSVWAGQIVFKGTVIGQYTENGT